MIIPLTIIISTLIIITFIILIINIITLPALPDRQKLSPFECGFDPASTSRIPFSLRFFLLAVIFLIFDIEIVLFLPMVFVAHLSQSKIVILITLIFILILLLGVLHEWYQGSLNWLN